MIYWLFISFLSRNCLFLGGHSICSLDRRLFSPFVAYSQVSLQFSRWRLKAGSLSFVQLLLLALNQTWHWLVTFEFRPRCSAPYFDFDFAVAGSEEASRRAPACPSLCCRFYLLEFQHSKDSCLASRTFVCLLQPTNGDFRQWVRQIPDTSWAFIAYQRWNKCLK